MQDYLDIFSNTWAILLVVLFFGGSIFVHEFGHFVAAKLCGLKVLRFSIGFGPKLISWTGADGCKYMVSLLPLGGYVALPQLADMGALEGGTEEDSAAKSLPPAGFAAKIIVSSAGALFNLLFAALLAAVVWIVGLPESDAYRTTTIGYVPEKISDIDGSKIPSPAFSAGLKPGDKILEIDSDKVSSFAEIIEAIALGSGRDSNGKPMAEIKILRDGKEMQMKVYPALIRTNLGTGDAIRMLGAMPAMKMKVGELLDNSPAQKAGIKVGDTIKGINSEKLYSNQQLIDILSKVPEGETVKLDISRDGKEMSLIVKPAKVVRTKSYCELSIPGDPGFSMRLFDSKNADASSVKVLSARGQFDYIPQPGFMLYKANGRDILNISQLNTVINHNSEKGSITLAFMSPTYEMGDMTLPKGSQSKITPPREQVMLGYILEDITIITHPSIASQFADSIRRTYGALESLLNPKSDVGINSLAGPVDIGRVIYKLSFADISLVLSFAVLLNINLAILNMLPIPVLDGGHILFAIISKIRGGPIPPNVFGAIQAAFTLLFLSLMVYVVYYGMLRWSGDSRYEREMEAVSEINVEDVNF